MITFHDEIKEYIAGKGYDELDTLYIMLAMRWPDGVPAFTNVENQPLSVWAHLILTADNAIEAFEQ